MDGQAVNNRAPLAFVGVALTNALTDIGAITKENLSLGFLTK